MEIIIEALSMGNRMREAIQQLRQRQLNRKVKDLGMSNGKKKKIGSTKL